MSAEVEAPHVYEDLEIEEKKNKVPEKQSNKRWHVPVAVVAGALFAAVCFGVGFAVAHFAVPSAGRSLGLDTTERILAIFFIIPRSTTGVDLDPESINRIHMTIVRLHFLLLQKLFE